MQDVHLGIESVRELLHGEYRSSRGRELEGPRQPVQSATDPDDGIGVGIVKPTQTCPSEEQPAGGRKRQSRAELPALGKLSGGTVTSSSPGSSVGRRVVTTIVSRVGIASRIRQKSI